MSVQYGGPPQGENKRPIFKQHPRFDLSRLAEDRLSGEVAVARPRWKMIAGLLEPTEGTILSITSICVRI